MEAHKVQIQSQQLEKDEMIKFMNEKQKKIVAVESNLIKQQQNEMLALRKKLDTIESTQIK